MNLFLLCCLAMFTLLAILFGVLSCNQSIIASGLGNITTYIFEVQFVLAFLDWLVFLICLATFGLNKFFLWITYVISILA